jgi:autotransporter adhesin
MLDKVIDQRSRTGRKVLRHGFASKLAVAFLQRC